MKYISFANLTNENNVDVWSNFPFGFSITSPHCSTRRSPCCRPLEVCAMGAVPCGSASSSSWVLLFMGRAPMDVLCPLLVSLVSRPSLAAAQDAGPHF